MRSALVCSLAWIAVWYPAHWALAGMTINGYSPATADRYDRFNNSASFLGNPYDWSGVGRTNTGKWGTLVSPSFVISARHFAPEQGTQIRFYEGNDPAGTFVERTIGASIPLTQLGFQQASDLVVTQLSAPVAGINFYPVAAPTSFSNLIGQEIYVWGQADAAVVQASMRLGRNEISGVIPALTDNVSTGTVFVFDYNTTSGLGPDEARVVVGDSGGPSFVIGPGGPTLIGVHWFNTEPSDNLTGNLQGSGDTLVSSFINEINSAMASVGSTERVIVAAVPEPAAALWWCALGMTCSLRRHRRKRALA